MGANHSNSHEHEEFWRENQTTPTSRHKSSIHPSDGGHRKKFKAKPNPPVQVTISAVTHSSVRFSWLPPRSDHGHPVIAYTIEACRPNKHGGKRWQVLTKNCQSTSYEAKHLESDTQYVFKVRAENVFGTGKPSPPSERVTTKVFEMSSDLNCYLSSTNANAAGAATINPASPGYNYQTTMSPYATLTSSCSMDFDQVGGNRASSDLHVAGGRSTSASGDYPHGSQVYPSYQSLKRRHSFNVQLDGGVTSILNHSDVFLNSSFSSSTSTITNNGNNRRMSQGNGLDADSKTLSLNRGMGHRSSMQPNGRKVSLSAFLPGAKAQSMNRLRESRSSLRSGGVGGSSSDFNGNTVTKTALLSLNRDSKRDNPRNSLASASSSSDVISSLSSNSKEENRRSRGSRCSLLSSQSDATVSNSHDGSRLSDYSSSMDNLDSTDFGDSPIPTNSTNSSSISSNGNNNINSFKVNLFSSLEDIVDQFGKTPTDGTLNETCDDDDDDEISKIKQELRNIELTDEKLRSQDTKPDLQFLTSPNRFNQNYYDILEDPWEKFPPIPESIMAAPFCDDIKIALYAKNITDDVTNRYHGSCDNLDEGNHDFRTLRSVLQSDQTIVRPTRPYPDMVGVVVGEAGEARTLTRGKLTTIEDADEDEDPVRVTSL